MTKHTKGWHYKQGEAGLIFDENGDIVCDMMPCEENKTELANANLAVMAPDMYEALEQMVSMYCELIDSGDCGNWNPREDDAVLIANAALKKARGES